MYVYLPKACLLKQPRQFIIPPINLPFTSANTAFIYSEILQNKTDSHKISWKRAWARRRYEAISRGKNERGAFNLKAKSLPLEKVGFGSEVSSGGPGLTWPRHVMLFPSIFSHWLSHSRHTDPLANSRTSLIETGKNRERDACIIDLRAYPC